MSTVPQRDDHGSSKYFRKPRPFWIGLQDRFMNHFVSVDMSSLWRRHAIHSKKGNKLRKPLTQRFSSTTIFLSVILAAEIGIITSPAEIVEDVRVALKCRSYNLEFWTGIVLSFSTLSSITALTSNYSAWAIFTAISDENMRVICASSMGLYAAQLPNILIVVVFYSFLLSLFMFWYILMPMEAATSMTSFACIFIVYVISAYSALGNLVMGSGSMSERRIVDSVIENEMNPQQLSGEILYRKQVNARNQLSIGQLYQSSGISTVTYGTTKGEDEALHSHGT